MSLNYSSIQKPLLCSSGSPSVNFLYGPYADLDELNSVFHELGMEKEDIPEYLTVLVGGTEYWYVGNEWVKKNDSKPSEDYTMDLTGRFTVSLDNDNLILDDDTSSTDLALHTNKVTLYDYGADVTSNCTNWTATIPSSSNLKAAINNGVVTLGKITEGKLVEGDYAVAITWNYTIQNEQGNPLNIIMTKKLQVSVKNFNQGESYKLLVTPTVIKLDYQNNTTENIVTKLIRIKNGISDEVENYTLKYKFASDSDLSTMSHTATWGSILGKAENLTLFVYINKDTLVDLQTITVMRDDNKLTLSNPMVILDDNTIDLDDIKNASITSVLFNGEEVTDVEVEVPVQNFDSDVEVEEETEKVKYFLKPSIVDKNAHRLPIVDTEFDVTYTYNGYSVIQRVKIANISQGQVYSLKASPQFVAVNSQGNISQAVNLIFNSIYRGETKSLLLSKYVVEYKFDGDSNWTTITSNTLLTLDGNILTFNNGSDYSSRNNLYIKVTDAEDKIVYDETEIAFVKAGADGKDSEAVGWGVSLDNDFFVLDDDVNSNVYASVSTTHPKIYYNSHDVTNLFKLVNELNKVKTTSTELKVIHDNDIDYHIAAIDNVTKLDTDSLGTTGKVLLYFVPKNILEGEDTVDITFGNGESVTVAANFILGATASYLINDISDGFSYKLEIDPPYLDIEYTTASTIQIPPPKKITLYKVSPKGTEVVPTTQYLLKYSINNEYISINSGDILTKDKYHYDNIGASSTEYTVSRSNPIKFAAFALDGETVLDVEYITLNMRGLLGPPGSSASVSDVINGLNITALRFKGEWKSGSTYKAAESSGNNLKMQDYVTVSTSPSTINLDSKALNVTYTVAYFKCILDITNSTALPNLDTSHWERIGSTDLVCGIVKAQTVQATSVLIQDTNQHLVAGVQGKETGTSNPIMFAGCDIDTNNDSNTTINIQNSPFRVYENGDVIANSLKFAGWQYLLSKDLTATNGSDLLQASEGANLLIGITDSVSLDGTYWKIPLYEVRNDNGMLYIYLSSVYYSAVINPSLLGLYVIVDNHKSVFLPSFAIQYDLESSVVKSTICIPGIKVSTDAFTLDNDYKDYMASCRLLVGNKLICLFDITTKDAATTINNNGTPCGGSITGIFSHNPIKQFIIDPVTLSSGHADASVANSILTIEDLDEGTILEYQKGGGTTRHYKMLQLECCHVLSLSDDPITLCGEMVYWKVIKEFTVENSYVLNNVTYGNDSLVELIENMLWNREKHDITPSIQKLI